MHPLTNLYSIIAQAREHKEMSIRKLAKLAKVSPTTIQKIEQGSDCRISVAEKVLKVFDLKAMIIEPEIEGWNSTEKKLEETNRLLCRDLDEAQRSIEKLQGISV